MAARGVVGSLDKEGAMLQSGSPYWVVAWLVVMATAFRKFFVVTFLGRWDGDRNKKDRVIVYVLFMLGLIIFINPIVIDFVNPGWVNSAQRFILAGTITLLFFWSRIDRQFLR